MDFFEIRDEMAPMRTVSTLTLILACSCIRNAQELRINTSAGIIIGTKKSIVPAVNQGESGEYYEFLGIPYAKPPTGDLRFEKPVKTEPFTTPYYANITANISCPCYAEYPWYAKSLFTEDCLYLNIFVPKGKHDKYYSNRPVMIYIHGGSFQSGSQNSFRAPEMAIASGVILVTLNYRLGVLGFLAKTGTHMKGNYGLWDQHMAIRWINENIESFGGNKSKVTLFGNSAGAGSVLYQAMYPGNKGLFQGVIAESGSPMSYWGYTKHPDFIYAEVMRLTECNTTKCLKHANVTDLLEFKDDVKPSVDGEFIRVFPELLLYHECFKEVKEVITMFGDINVIIGISSNDGGYIMPPIEHHFEDGVSLIGICIYFSAKIKLHGFSAFILTEYMKNFKDLDLVTEYTNISQTILDIERDFTFTLPAFEALQLHSKAGGVGRTYFYVFDHRPAFSNSIYWMKGASHSDELPYVFSFAASVMWDFYQFSINDTLSELDENEIKMSQLIVSFWTRFAETGNPNFPENSELWPEYKHDSQKFINFKILGDSFTQQHQYFSKERVFLWRRQFADMLRRSTRNACVQELLRTVPPLPERTAELCKFGRINLFNFSIVSGSEKKYLQHVYICLCCALCLMLFIH